MDKVGSGATTNVIASEGKKFKSIILLERSDPHRYSELNADLEKDQHFGDDHYHVTPSATFDLFVHRFGYFQQRGGDGRGRGRSHGGRSGGHGGVRLSLAQMGCWFSSL